MFGFIEMIAGIGLLVMGIFFLAFSIQMLSTLRKMDKATPIGYKHGMVIDERTGELVGTRTPVYIVDGITFLGKTEEG